MTDAAPPAHAPHEDGIAEVEMADEGAELVGEWTEEHDAVLSTLASSNIFSVPWPVLRALLKRKLRANVELFLAMPSHAATTPAVQPGVGGTAAAAAEQPSGSGSSGEAASAAAVGATASGELPHAAPDLAAASKVNGAPAAAAANGNGIDDGSAEARVDPGGLIGGRTLPAFIQREEADVLEGRVGRLLDGFETNPPFTIQRLTELVAAPTASHASLGKYLRALLRVLDVHSEWTAPAVDGPLASSGAAGAGASSSTGSGASVPGASGGAWSVGTPLFSPIAFLARADANDEEGAAPSDDVPMSPMALGSPLPIRSSPPPNPARTSPLPTMAALQPSNFSPPSVSPPSASAVTTAAHGGQTTLSSDELIVDELDGGLALPSPSSADPSTSSSAAAGTTSTDVPPRAHEGEGANQQAHLLSPSPRAFTSTTTTAPTAADGRSATPPSAAAAARVRARSDEDDEMTGPAPAAPDADAERFARSKSPTPDVVRVAATAGEGRAAAVVVAGGAEPAGGSGGAASTTG